MPARAWGAGGGRARVKYPLIPKRYIFPLGAARHPRGRHLSPARKRARLPYIPLGAAGRISEARDKRGAAGGHLIRKGGGGKGA